MLKDPYLSISQIGRPSLEISPLVLSILLAVTLIPIILTMVSIIRTKRQKKTLASTIVYDNQLLSIKGEAQREPLKDRTGGLPNYLSGNEYFNAYEWERSASSNKVFNFCNKICLTIRNEGALPVDTDVCEEPLALSLDVKGKLAGIRVLDVKPSSPKLNLIARDGIAIVDHLHLEPSESLQIEFLGYFAVNLEELC